MRRANVLSFFALALALVAGCNTPNPEPPDAARPDGGPRDAYAGDAPSDAGTDAGRDVGTPDAGDSGPEVDAYVEDTGTPVDADIDAFTPDAFSCDDPTAHCYRCPPTTDEQFINHCTAPGVTCEPFPVTTARLPHLNADGTVPPLP